MSRPAKARLAAEILFTYLITRRRMHRTTLPRLVEHLRKVDNDNFERENGSEQAARLGRAVTLTLSRAPTDSKCLVRSLVLLRILARRGIEGVLVIAARPGPEVLDAHAWIEVGGRPVLPAGSAGYGRLVTL
jgi:hypothetical protein